MDLSTFTDDELEALRVQVRGEVESRAEARRMPAQAAAVVEAVASGRTPDPITVAGPDGKTWTLVVQEQTVLQGAPEWDAAAAYKTGAEVTFSGRRYAAVQDSTGKQPDASPSFWQGL